MIYGMSDRNLQIPYRVFDFKRIRNEGYCDIAGKDNLGKLFGGLEIARNPTANRNRYQVLYMDFSLVNRGIGDSLQERFEKYAEALDQLAKYRVDPFSFEGRTIAPLDFALIDPK